MQFLCTFIILSIVNVVFSTIRTLTTVKSGKTVASIISGGYFAFYNIVLIYTVADFPMWQKCLITFICNVIGVFVVKLLEEKVQKEKLWKVEATITNDYKEQCINAFTALNVPFNYIDVIPNHTIFNIFCATKIESNATRELLKRYNAKYFVSETKNL